MIKNNINLGELIMQRHEEASRFSLTQPEEGLGVTRLFLTHQHRQVIELVKEWMLDAGMQYELDNVGNLIGKLQGTDPSAKALVLGSHVDTVKQGGKYDGMLGVILPIVCLKALQSQNVLLPYPVIIAAFGDEEGTRFQDSMMGSRALAGNFDSESLQREDENGITMSQALVNFGLDPKKISECALKPEQIAAYLEIHIEQGPMLENKNLSVGVVTDITGIERHQISFLGETGHAGTVPMDQRQDALVAASQAILDIDIYLQNTDELVGVVGELTISPGSVNTIPGVVRVTLELRSPRMAVRDSARQFIADNIDQIARQRGLQYTIQQNYSSHATACSQWLINKLSDAISCTGYDSLKLFSGAGHDAQAMSSLTDIVMLFVRCNKGLSHHPNEAIRQEDADVAARVVIEFMKNFNEK